MEALEEVEMAAAVVVAVDEERNVSPVNIDECNFREAKLRSVREDPRVGDSNDQQSLRRSSVSTFSN